MGHLSKGDYNPRPPVHGNLLSKNSNPYPSPIDAYRYTDSLQAYPGLFGVWFVLYYCCSVLIVGLIGFPRIIFFALFLILVQIISKERLFIYSIVLQIIDNRVNEIYVNLVNLNLNKSISMSKSAIIDHTYYY